MAGAQRRRVSTLGFRVMEIMQGHCSCLRGEGRV